MITPTYIWNYSRSKLLNSLEFRCKKQLSYSKQGIKIMNESLIYFRIIISHKQILPNELPLKYIKTTKHLKSDSQAIWNINDIN